MVIEELIENKIEQDRPEEPMVKSESWECEAWRLDGWRPKTALLHYSLFNGPYIPHGKGIDLKKNLVIYCCGARGGEKTLTMTFLLCKEMRMGKSVWTNYPISFYVVEVSAELYAQGVSDQFIQVSHCHWINTDGTVSYYESMPLDMDKFYTFDREIRNGAVGIDELQYFVEARTSGKFQNRVASYQLMQIRKTANSFFYTVQNPKWVDNRFGWSADIEIKCEDLSAQSVDHREFGRELQEGEYGCLTPKDLSGVATGKQYSETGKDLGHIQFDAYKFWNTYPTHFIVDPEAAANSANNVNPNAKKKKERQDAEAQFQAVVEEIVSEDIELGKSKIASKELWQRVADKGINMPHNKAGEILRSMGIAATNTRGNWYSYALIKQNQRES